MSDETKPPEDEWNGSVPLRPGEIRLRPVQQGTVSHLKEAAPVPEEKAIHTGRPLPVIPQKRDEDADESLDQAPGRDSKIEKELAYA